MFHCDMKQPMKNSNSENSHFISHLIHESRSYDSLDNIRKLIENEKSLSLIPAQPLYHVLRHHNSHDLARILPHLSKRQRQFFIDLDLWNRDVISVYSFERWIGAYANCTDENIIVEFVKTEDFLLFLKARINIWTFDAEDPLYPDHDYYFLTDDGLLLVEYDENFNLVNELKYLIRQLYSDLGVEKAYAFLFKLINDQFSLLQEDIYQQKKSRLEDFGLVDYYQASQMLFPLVHQSQVVKTIKEAKKINYYVDELDLNQALPSFALVSFEKDIPTSLEHELMLVKHKSIQEFLFFNFIRLINATMVKEDAMSASPTELSALGLKTKTILNLAIEFCRKDPRVSGVIPNEESLLEYFDFAALYRLGITLFEDHKKKLKKVLKQYDFDQELHESFLGRIINDYLDFSFEETPKYKRISTDSQLMEREKVISTYEFWQKWIQEGELVASLIPFIHQFYLVLKKLKENDIQDSFYENYAIADLDFEVIILTSVINFSLGHGEIKSLAISHEKLLKFISLYITDDGEKLLSSKKEELRGFIQKFATSFGFANSHFFHDYILRLIIDNLTGINIKEMAYSDYKHIGGVLLLKL
jgi:hypothetical protein